MFLLLRSSPNQAKVGETIFEKIVWVMVSSTFLKYSSLFGEIIQFDLRIFFRWVG